MLPNFLLKMNDIQQIMIYCNIYPVLQCLIDRLLSEKHFHQLCIHPNWGLHCHQVSPQSMPTWWVDISCGALFLIKTNFGALSAASWLQSFEWTNPIAENPLSEPALEVTMLNSLMATSLRVGYDIPSSQYWMLVFVPFDNILNWKLFLILSEVALMT